MRIDQDNQSQPDDPSSKKFEQFGKPSQKSPRSSTLTASGKTVSAVSRAESRSRKRPVRDILRS